MKYVVTKPVVTDNGVYIRMDEVVVEEKDLKNVMSFFISEPWFSKLTIRRKED